MFFQEISIVVFGLNWKWGKDMLPRYNLYIPLEQQPLQELKKKTHR